MQLILQFCARNGKTPDFQTPDLKDRLQSHLRMCGLCLHFLF